MAVALSVGVLVALPVGPAESAQASGPVIEQVHYTDYIVADDFFIDLCGIVTNTTVKETDILQTFPDGTQTFHTERSFIPDDPRLPIEKGAGTSWFAADHETILRIAGKPIQLFEPDGGIRALDAGLLIIGDPNVSHGHVDVGKDNPDLAPFYCPPSS